MIDMKRSSYPSSKRCSKGRPWNYREEEEEEEVEVPESNEDEEYGGYERGIESNRSSKMRKLEEFNSGYEFRPRGILSGRGCDLEWNDQSTYVLLDAWGDRFLQLGRSSLRTDDWTEVADRVSELTGSEFSVSDCRTRLNDLKNKYKKERSKLDSGGTSKLVYFKKMEILLTMPQRQQQHCGLACGVDSGEFVFMDPKVYLDQSNALDEMRDSPGISDAEEEEGAVDSESYRMLSESIKRVGEIYENIESNKRQHMMELDRMRMEFQRDLEMHKEEMIETTRAEMQRLSKADAEDHDVDASPAHSASQ